MGHMRPSVSGKRKRVRTTFSKWQLQALETTFAQQQYVVGSDRNRLALMLGLSQIQVWYTYMRVLRYVTRIVVRT